MATHKFQIAYDEATGEVRAVHRCTVEVAGLSADALAVSHAENIPLDPSWGILLKGQIDVNREVMDRQAARLAVVHAAALAGKAPPGGVVLKAGGLLGPAGTT